MSATLAELYRVHVTCKCKRVEAFPTAKPGQAHICPGCGRILSVEPTNGRIYGLVDGRRTENVRMEYKQSDL